jgi:hypothetical protein
VRAVVDAADCDDRSIDLGILDWQGAFRYAATLEEYTRPEPLPWSDLFISRGRALVAAAQATAGVTVRQSLETLLKDLDVAGLKPWPTGMTPEQVVDKAFKRLWTRRAGRGKSTASSTKPNLTTISSERVCWQRSASTVAPSIGKHPGHCGRGK